MSWKEEKVKFLFGFGLANARTETAEDAVALIDQGMLFLPNAFRVSAGGNPEEGLFVTVALGEPYNHHCSEPKIRLEYPRWDARDIFWSRSNPSLDDFVYNTMTQAFGILFEVVFASRINEMTTIVIEYLGGNAAADALIQFLKARPNSITEIEALNTNSLNQEPEDSSHHRQRTVDFCCRVIANNDDLKVFSFEKMTEVSEDMIMQLFRGMKDMNNLETIDFRTNRFMTSTGKAQGIYDHEHGAGPLSITPLVCALTEANKSAVLKNLYFGGRQLSSDSVVDLANAMPHLRLRKLSLRACGLDERAMIAIVKSLVQRTELRELDLSHNTFTIDVMAELCLALKSNTFLEKIVLEHCGIDLPQVQCLTEALPEIKNVRYLWMDGNAFTWTPTMYAARTKDPTDISWYRVAPVYSIGATTLAKAMPSNTSLLEVKMGEFGKLVGFSMVCCTPPPYKEHIWESLNVPYRDALLRNSKHYQATRWTKVQKAVTNIAALLLAKLAEQNNEVPRTLH